MARPRYDLHGKTVFITGPARGIGAETARQLARRGARLALAGLEPELLEQVAAECGDGTPWFEADVRDAGALERAVAGTVERLGGIDVVIANAGIGPPVTTIARMDPADFERVIDVNLLGVWRTVRAALPHVVERRGYVLVVASLAAALHSVLMAPYAAAKAGVEAFGDCLRAEVVGDGVDVGVAYFGFIDTDMVREAFDDPATQVLRDQSPGFLVNPIPVSRAGRAITRGVERRARRVVEPRPLVPALLASGLFQQLFDFGVRRRGLDRVLRSVEPPEQKAAP